MRKGMYTTCLTVMCGLVLAATGLWAAGQEEGSTATAADKRYVTDPTTGKVVAAPEYGGTLNLFGFPGATQLPIDPYFGWASLADGVSEKLGSVNWGVDRDVSDMQTLFTLSSDLEGRGRLAESWDMSPDGLTYTFHIRKGVRWHDKAPMNGRELTAHDIVFNFHRMLGMGDFTEAGPTAFGGADPLKNIPWESITATDDSTVVMKLTEPHLPAPSRILTHWFVYIMPPEVIEQHGDVRDWRNFVGTGPFMLTDIVEGASLTYAKNPDYWGFDEKYPENRLPYVDEVTRLEFPEEATALAALRSGKIDFIPWRTVDAKLSLEDTNPEIVAHRFANRSNDSLAPDHRKPPFDDINVRRAMQMALDNENIAVTYWKGLADPTPAGLIAVKGYHIPFEEWDDEVKQYYRYDPEAAEKLLDEAGYPRGADGTRFKTTLNHGSFASVDFAEIAAAYWAEIGVEVEVDVLSGAEYHERLFGRAGEGMYSAIAGTLYDPTQSGGWYHSDSQWNRGGSQWPELDAMIDAALSARTVEEQQRLIAEADQYAMSRHWLIWGPKTPQYFMAQPWLIGFNGEANLFGNGEPLFVFARLWIDSALKTEMGF